MPLQQQNIFFKGLAFLPGTFLTHLKQPSDLHVDTQSHFTGKGAICEMFPVAVQLPHPACTEKGGVASFSRSQRDKLMNVGKLMSQVLPASCCVFHPDS